MTASALSPLRSAFAHRVPRSGPTTARERAKPGGRRRNLTHGRGGGAHYLATGESTGGLFGLYRWMMGPEPAGPAPHFHRSIAESFYVLTGVILIHDGRGWRECGPDDFVHVPPGGVHGFRNEFMFRHDTFWV